MPAGSILRLRVAFLAAAVTGAAVAARAARPAPAPGIRLEAVQPNPGGPARLICASPYGRSGNDTIVGAAVGTDGSIILAGNRDVADLKRGGGTGFLLRLTVQGDTVTPGEPVTLRGTIARMKLAPGGSVCLLVQGAGVFMLPPGGARPVKSCTNAQAADFGVDAGGELVVLHGSRMTRYDRTWRREKWSATWHAHGRNVPGALAVCPTTGVAAVVGYGMTHTGREPWKDPYAHGFDRAGRRLWTLWDPDPRKQVSASHGGTGLMADTTGKVARAGGGGKVLLHLYADGGNSVCTRDPSDAARPIAPEVFDGVYQGSPGHGFKGASKTSVAFRVDAKTGKLEKGTWMCAWLNPGRANALAMNDLATDEKGRIFIVGSSASGCPTKLPWLTYDSGYMGGGFLAVLDEGFGMLQCGFFQQTHVACVAAGGGLVVIGGRANVNRKDPNQALRVVNPIQKGFAGGESDGFLAIFRTAAPAADKPVAPKPPKPRPPRPAPGTTAGRILAEARAAIARRNVALAREKLRYLVVGHPNSPEAEVARAMLADPSALRPRPAVRPRPTTRPKPEDTEQRAEQLLQRAENYLRNKMPAHARRILEQIVREHPKTSAAKQARLLLNEHFPDE